MRKLAVESAPKLPVDLSDAAGLAALEDARARSARDVARARDEERQRLARELHDGASQTLTAAKLTLERLAIKLAADPKVGDQLRDAAQLVAEGIRELRRLCMDLRPPLLDSRGLGPALEAWVHGFGERTGLRVALALGRNLGLTSEMERDVFRIVQEALLNVAKHAGARRARARVVRRGAVAAVHIIDDGCGLGRGPAGAAASGIAPGLGQTTMAERAALHGGRFRCEPRRRGRGTRVVVTIPVAPEVEPLSPPER